MSASVIIVDDDDSVRADLTQLLRIRGYHTRQFASAEACRDLLASAAWPACIVTELRLPGMDGLALQSALASRFPFIVLTGYADVPTAVATLLGGAIEFLEKPVMEERLLAAVDKGLALAQATHTYNQAAAELQRKFGQLTPREQEVMSLVTTGMRNKEIAMHLGTAEKTIKVHRAHIMQKLNLESLAEMVRCADQLGMAPIRPT
ncbi:response regulator transcription factor [Cupriavidus pauculus]|nr:LuxR C-terminal-related transcriptional regulator [Cupriavidus pauculus]